jgi:hypothetical protein
VTVWDRTCCGLPGDGTLAGMNVRRLAAIGVWLAAFSSGLGGRVLGLWMAGSGLNYVPHTRSR